MKKKITSIALILALVAALVGGSTLFNSIDAKAEVYRNGYALIPQKEDATGIETTTTFLLKSKENDITLEEVQSELIIKPDMKFNVKEDKEGFLITLEKDLEKNNLYTFNFKNATWTFQTMTDFKVLGSLPRTESNNVPVNTGIEFYFSHYGAEVNDYFEIEPSVKGSFETHGNVVVFVPKELDEKTIYTVTLKAGLPLKDSAQKLKEDYTFTFETAAKDESSYKEPNGYFSFNNFMNEFGTEEAPRISMNYNIYKKTDEDTIKANIYAYKTSDDFIKVLEDFNDVPTWSYFGYEENKISTKDLSNVMSFEQLIDYDRSHEQFLNLPEKLPAGYYLVDCTWDDINFQTLIQVTDVSFYYIESIDGSLVWLNDLKTGKAINKAKITEVNSGKSYSTNEKGIAEIKDQEENDNIQVYKIESEGRSAVLLAYNGYRYYGGGQGNMFWRYFQTDRNLYKPHDTVKFWGFLKQRYEDVKIDEVTVEIAQGGWFYWDCLPYFGQEMAYVTETIKVENGFYDGELTLPNLDEGGYQITVKYNDETIASSYINVENYVKPAYKIEISKDKEAIFVGETVNFTVDTTFFEGTPVSNLDVNYNIGGMDYIDGSDKSDLKGKTSISYTPKYQSDYQGIVYSYFNAYARLPESGQIYGNDNIRVFVNDIHVGLDAKIEDKKGIISANVNEIVLDRLNDGTAEDEGDYLGNAVAGKKITGTIYKNEWKKREVGEYYDFINKEVRKRYDYYNEKTKLKDIVLITNNEGEAKAEINLPDDLNCYYTAELTTTDNAGRKMTFSEYFGNDWEYNPYYYDRYMLKADKEEYEVDETMELLFVNNDEPLESGSYLYVTAQNGIKDYDVTNSSSYSRAFDASSVPNVEIRGIYFNGKTYIQSESFRARLNIEKNKIVFTAETDKTEYKPGEECTVKLNAKVYSTEAGTLVNAKDVFVNVSIVDEALLKLSDQSIDTLEYLYGWVPGGIHNTYASHSNMGNNIIGPLRFGINDVAKADMAMDGIALTFDEGMEAEQAASEVYVRSEFKDTALFRTVRLDENGEGTLTFKLPDNVTAWRMTFAGISESLKAGTNVEELRVTLPYFINTSLNTTYLVGDKPYIGVTTYGNELKEGEKVNYEVSCEETGYVTTANGNAFERVNIPLWEMKEGNYTITIKAVSESGYTDGLEQVIKVVKTYHQMETADYYDLTPGLNIETTDQGITQLTFVDQGKGRFMPALYSLSYSGGKRIDQKYLAYEARKLLVDTFGVELYANEEVELLDYQTENGGFAILPYAESDIETTVKLLPIVKDKINAQKVKMYLYNELNNAESRNKAAAVYGLAVLSEPVLLEIKQLEEISNLNMKDQIYLALAYAEIGAVYEAETLYDEEIAEYVDSYDNTARVKYGKNEDSYLEYTALTMLLASKLDLDNKDLFFEYVVSEYSKELLVNTEKFVYIMSEIDQLTDQELTVTYTYDGKTYEKKVENGWPVTIKVPSSKLNDFDVKKVDGDAAVVAVYTKELETTFDRDSDLKAFRTFYSYTTGKETKEFQQSDIVKVMINWDIAKTAIDDGYMITDYVPSGLKPIESVWEMGLKDGYGYWYRDVEGQKVTFYVNKNSKERKPLYYYARVVTPGTYKAEGTIIQGTKVKESMNIGDIDTIVIND